VPAVSRGPARWALPLLFLAACAQDGRVGSRGVDGTSCNVVSVGHDALLRCTDGSQHRILEGVDGEPGAQGPPGRNGEPGTDTTLSSAVRLSTPPSCAGGVVIEEGLDLDRDGTLSEAEEVRGRVELCPPPPTCERLEASIVFQNSWELAELEEAGCSTVLDDLQVVIPDLPDLHWLRGLREVGGGFVVAGTAITDLEDLRALRRVGTLALVNDRELASLEGLRDLEHAGEIDLETLPALGSLQGLEGITQTADLIVAGTGALDLEPLAGLTVAPLTLSIRSNPRLARVALPATVGSLEAVEIRDNPELISLAGLRPAEIRQVLVVSGNRRLPTCEAMRLLDALVVKPERVEISGNDDDGVCP
jgi:hypothetical protein